MAIKALPLAHYTDKSLVTSNNANFVVDSVELAVFGGRVASLYVYGTTKVNLSTNTTYSQCFKLNDKIKPALNSPLIEGSIGGGECTATGYLSLRYHGATRAANSRLWIYTVYLLAEPYGGGRTYYYPSEVAA